jgi:hypothetical protein
MSREGKGTEATTEAGRSHPLPWSEAERGWLAAAGSGLPPYARMGLRM